MYANWNRLWCAGAEEIQIEWAEKKVMLKRYQLNEKYDQQTASHLPQDLGLAMIPPLMAYTDHCIAAKKPNHINGWSEAHLNRFFLTEYHYRY